MFSLRFYFMQNCLRDVFIYSQLTWKTNQSMVETNGWDKTCARNFTKLSWRSDRLIKSAGNAHYGLSRPSSCEAPPSLLQWFYCCPELLAGTRENSSWPCICLSAGCNQARTLGAPVVLVRSCLVWPLLTGCKVQGKPGALCRPELCTILGRS